MEQRERVNVQNVERDFEETWNQVSGFTHSLSRASHHVLSFRNSVSQMTMSRGVSWFEQGVTTMDLEICSSVTLVEVTFL